MASNAARIFVDKELEHTDLTGYFTKIISATTDYGMVKKGEEFYKMLCRELDVEPEDIIHIGDHPAFDYRAPMSLGIKAYLFKSSDPLFSIHHNDGADKETITRLKDILGLI